VYAFGASSADNLVPNQTLAHFKTSRPKRWRKIGSYEHQPPRTLRMFMPRV